MWTGMDVDLYAGMDIDTDTDLYAGMDIDTDTGLYANIDIDRKMDMNIYMDRHIHAHTWTDTYM
jgi:hypothetical protein